VTHGYSGPDSVKMIDRMPMTTRYISLG
jgi:hypothetical protein